MTSDSDYTDYITTYSEDEHADYITTYSEDERIALSLSKEKANTEAQTKSQDEERKQLYEEYKKKCKNVSDSIFNLKGMKFLKFSSEKVKFTFQPCEVSKNSPGIIFYCTLKYRNKFWFPRRDTFPVTCKSKIYGLFHLNRGFEDDAKYKPNKGNETNEKEVLRILIYRILRIHEILVEWSEERSDWREGRNQEYELGEDIILDSEDEELYLEKDEIQEIHRKRRAVLRRMLLPGPHGCKRRRRLVSY